MISDYTIQKVLENADCKDVVSDFLELKRKGVNFVCCCPFHTERTPSFTVSPVRNRWHCYGCGRDGDAVAFLMEYRHLAFPEAIEWLAKKYGIEVKYDKRERTEQEQEEAAKREAMLVSLDIIQQFYTSQLAADNPEAGAARSYTFARWPEEFCRETGIGYAPKSSQPLFSYIKRKGLDTDLLLELGIIADGERGRYAQLRERITIPIKNRWGKIVGFTARYVGQREDVAKYLNSSTSLIYKKDECVFGLDLALRQVRVSECYIMVEGAPDVLRLQSIGLHEAVAPLGTALTRKQLEQMRRYCRSVRFIPDSDPSKDGTYGTGVQAVMKNGITAMHMGFNVYVRELPRSKEDDENGVKRDPDSYFKNREDYNRLDDSPFVIWYAEKKFATADTTEAKVSVLKEVAALIVHIEDEMIRDLCIDGVSKQFGKPKMWREAIREAGRKLRESAEEEVSGFDKREVEMLRSLGIMVRNNMYYAPNKDGEMERWSNFIMRPIFHVKHREKSTRIFNIVNQYGQEEPLELTQKTLGSLQTFQVAIESLGNFVWFAKADKFNRLKEYLYAVTETAEEINVLGWNGQNRFFAFANGIHTGERFIPIDETGLVRYADKSFFLPAFSKMNINDDGAFDFERMYEYTALNTDTLYQYVERVVRVFGNGGKVGFAWLLACMFRDHIRSKTNWFPLLNLFGIKGSGKTALATALASFFYVFKKDPPKLGNITIPAMSYMFCHARNSVIVLDEYTNLLNPRIIDILKGIWGGTANTKMNTLDGGQGIVSTPVYSGVIFCGQHQPTADPAVFSRCVHLSYSKTTFTAEENIEFNALKDASNRGNAHLAMQIMRHRKLFTDNFETLFRLTRKEMKKKFDTEPIEDRILDNWVCVLASFRVLETSIDVPFSYAELFDICADGIRYQNAEINKSSETSDFWNTINSLRMVGKIIEGTHYVIKYQSRFKAWNSDNPKNFGSSHALLYMNWSAVQGLLSQRSNVNLMKMDLGSLDNYLRTSPYFLGLKQQRFTVLAPNGSPDCTYEMKEGKPTKYQKEVRPLALVFDYETLKQRTDIDLETFVASEQDTDNEMEEAIESHTEPRQQDLPF